MGGSGLEVEGLVLICKYFLDWRGFGCFYGEMLVFRVVLGFIYKYVVEKMIVFFSFGFRLT